jgi:uncharacterized membrane protein YobD (UPF0266 family)
MNASDTTSRKLYESADQAGANGGTLRRDGLFAGAIVLVGLLVALIYATVTGISDWSQLVVLGGIVLVTVSVMIAIDPLRRG